jgi:hypothetical protein
MSVLKHLKTLQPVSIIIQIIFRELVGSLLKSLNLKVFINFFKIVEVICGNAAAKCLVCVRRKHTKRYVAALPQITSTILKIFIKTFKFSDFNKEPTSSLKMI